ncbi:MAG: hydroxyacid dehydrogenase [Deltaproteobacteria bacterium]|nr:hydroxyacid dehydrogenase [Deltaproteobacteria bacterium]
MLILISDAFDASLPERLKDFGEVTDDKSRVAEAEVVLIRSKTKCTREYIDAAPKLKYIIRGGVGLDNVDQVYAKEKGIRVENTADASSVAVAELAMALMLAPINHVVAGHNGMAGGKWLKKELKRTELYKKTLGLIGIGRIGTEVAKRCQAFGMKVIAFDAYVDKHEIAELKSLDEVLAQSDFISLHTPLTDETRSMINADRLALTKEGVIFVNTARGLVVDEAAMTKALESGHVACYATDVWSSDPPPADCPLTSAPRMLMTPHIGASSKENLGRIGDIVVDKLQGYQK